MTVQDRLFYDRGYYDETLLHPLGAAAVVLLGTLTLTVPRRVAVLPFLLLICFVPCSQRIAIAGLDFNLMRILIIFGWIRVLSKGELREIKLTTLDKLVLSWGLVEAVVYFALYRNFGAIVTMAGRMFELLGGYMMARCFIRTWSDVLRLAQIVVWISVPVAIAFAIEKATGRNFFSVFGGVPAVTMVREGKLRAAGALGNPILAGCFWAALAPLAGALWWVGGRKLAAVVGVTCATVVVVACASSTPLAALAAGIFAAFMFKARHQMREIRWGVVLTLFGLHLVMEAPVWHLISRIDLVGGSTGWHRYKLIDQWIHKFREWALLGTKGTGHWGPGLEDITNQYVLESVRGGIWAFGLFVATIAVAFRNMGFLWRSAEGNKETSALAWGLGACLFVHCSAFIAVSYFGQMNFGWFLNLAVISGLTAGLGLSTRSAVVSVSAAPPSKPSRVSGYAIRRRRRLLGDVVPLP